MKEEVIILEDVEKTEIWYLWQIEDKVANRWSHVFCSPSLEMIRRQYNEILEKNKSKKSEVVAHLIGCLDKYELVRLEEVIGG